MSSGPPGLFIPIDYGFFNVRLAEYAKSKGWQVLYFVPPGSWRRTKQGADLPTVTDQIVTPFPWSAEILDEMGAHAHFFGHPLKQMVAEDPTVPLHRQGIAILPGSRIHEIEHNLPAIAEALANIPEAKEVTFAVAQNLDPDEIDSRWKRLSPLPATLSRETYAVLKSAQAAIVCSGTATLEAALCRCPTVVVYRGSKWMELEFKIRKPEFDYVSLPNILLDRLVLPELLQSEANADQIAAELRPLLSDSVARQTQESAFEELDSMLGPPHALDETVALAAEMLGLKGPF